METCVKCGVKGDMLSSQIVVQNLRNGNRKIAVNHQLCSDCETEVGQKFFDLAEKVRAELDGDVPVDEAGADSQAGNPDDAAGEPREITSEEIVDTLSMLDIAVDVETVKSWDVEQTRQAAEYATVMFDETADEPDMPEFLNQYCVEA